MKVLKDLAVSGQITVGQLLQSSIDTDKFIVSDGGVAKFRTGSQLLGDIDGVINTRTITINGTAQDLTANRSWTVGDVRTDSSYANPAWITSLAWSKITGAPAFLTSYSETDPIYTSERDALLLNKMVHSTQLWSTLADFNRPSGYSTMIQPSSYQNPVGTHGYFHVIARRDAGGGYGVLLQAYNSGEIYHGNTTDSTQNISWYRIWNSSNFNPSNYLPLAGGTLTGKVTFPSAVENRPQMPGGILGLDTSDGNFDIWGISRDYYPSHATAANAWGILWNGDNNQIRFIGAGSQRLVIDLDGGSTGALTWEGNNIWHAGNLTNLNQLTNGPGYITSYTETDTLASVTGRGASTNTFVSLLGGSRIVVQNSTDGGNNRGIFMWNTSDTNWGIYMSTAGASKSLANGTAPTGIDGSNSHHIRFRIAGSSGNGFIWENHSEQTLMSVRGDNGNLYVRGQIYAGNSTTNQVWHSGNLTNLNQLTNGPGYITSYTETDTLASVTARGSSTTGSITVNGYTTIAGGADLNLKAASGNTDTGDIVFQDGSGNELHRLWQGSSTLNYRTNGGTTYSLWHSGNLTNLNQLTNGPGYITSSGSITGSAGSVAWTNVTGRPSALSSFTNDIVARTTLSASGDFQFGGQDLAQNNFSLSSATTDTDQFGRHYYSGTSGSIWSRYLPVDKSGKYRMKIRWKASAGSTTYVAVILLDTNGNNINGAGTYWAYPFSGGAAPTSWTTNEYWYDGSSFPSNAAYVAFGISHTNYGGGSATYYVSQLEIERYHHQISGNNIWHSGNLTNLNQLSNGPGYLTSLGFSYSTGVNANHVVQRDANGYIYANHINFSTPESENPTISSFFTSNGDGWSRKSSIAHVRNQLGNYGNWITASSLSSYLPLSGGTMSGNLYIQSGGNPTQFNLRGTNPELYVDATYGGGTARLFINRQSNANQATLLFTTGATVTNGTAWNFTGAPIWSMGMTNSSQVSDFKLAYGDIFDANSVALRIDTNKIVYFTNTPYVGGNIIATQSWVSSQGYLTSGSFLPLSGGTMSGKLFTVSTGTGTYDTAIEIRETGYAGTGQSAWGYSPAMTFHWGGRYAKRFGMRSDGLFAVDDVPIVLNSGTWGISITGNADTTDGLHVHSGRNNEADKIVRTDGNGYIQAGWINTTSGSVASSTAPARIYASDDGYIRYYSLEDFKVALGLPRNSYNRSINYSGTVGYHTGSMGHGAGYDVLNALPHFGSGFIDFWSGAPNAPDSDHWVGIQSWHAVNWNGVAGRNYGWQLVHKGGTQGDIRFHAQWADSDYGWISLINSANYTQYTLPRGGSWYGVNVPGSRWGGFTVSGGEIVFGDGLPNAGQMGMLIDGAYLAGENNGFWSLPSNNDWNGRRGMYWDGSYLNFTTNSPTSVFTTLRLANGFELQQGGSNYGQFNSWVHLPGFHGLYSGQNSAHIYPNNGTYGSWMMSGSRNGWQGIEFNSGSAGNVTMMVNTDSNTSGFHNNSYGWQIRWNNGTLYVGKNSYGGNDATVWDSSNAPRANYSNLVYYSGFTLNADTMPTNSTGFTYSVNAPTTGPIVRFGDGGYDMELNSDYYWGSNLYFRGRNGDLGVWRSWRRLLNVDSDPYAANMNQYVRTSDSVTFGSATLNGQVYINRHIDANTTWGNCGCTTIFVGWSTAKVMLGNGNTGAHDWSNDRPSNSVVSTMNHYFYNNVYAREDVVAYWSDARLKTNVKPIENALEKINKIGGYFYTPNQLAIDLDATKDMSERVGVMAQEIEEVLPHVVKPAPFNENFKTVQYEKLVPLLIQGIKEQQKQIDELKEQLKNR